MSRIAGLLKRTFWIVREHVGSDHLGNNYYMIPQQKTWTGRSVRAKRMVETANPNEYEYMEGSIPSEWDAWIRGRRKEPPSIEQPSTAGQRSCGQDWTPSTLPLPPCRAPSFPGPSRHKLIGLNPVINRLEKQLRAAEKRALQS
ncbi:NADH dehydrogenase [ubiquinone] 1 alpha subcomplex assembly factor 2 isoform X2 [Gadus morhua]|uniref:NADH dehydrogenase [ubiquinone] 1 alpha subcomplex assembly factor 2 isoform X2 n=1 Tax=Gadus morhua TaxID=8049 RepID=UPI0011B7BBA9|nr:NADH dehydrogenase [ubiquinone] 1 alpha subcomplex assembly factor 2 isoform X2 [Gadus morhua]XP_056448970.1 NADH dehydrogenase [ubiquinone] 1 alpha subcomplex assembly factor 2 isoform X1 [Gadus chalcogrammus]XP_059910624.1 NADH dehydrogenase [ubiquinone] 1 alpha subcomplex assembly factor 2 isoform X2 [Gadus macrocephalus]